MNVSSKCSGDDSRKNNVSMGGIYVNTLANAIIIAMRMNDNYPNRQHQASVGNVASAVVRALETTATTTNKSLRATSTMISVNDSIISPPLSSIYHQYSATDDIQDKISYVSIASLKKLQNESNLSCLPTTTNNNNVEKMSAVASKSKPVLEWSLTSKGKDLLIIGNHTFKCDKTTTTKRYWRCDEIQYCNIWVQTTLDGTYIDINKEEHDHFPDPDRIVIKRLITNIRIRCKEELGSLH